VSFNGKRILALESRRAVEIAELIRRQGGAPVVAPSLRETPVGADPALREFGERLFAGAFDMMILMTGVGTRHLNKALSEAFPDKTLADALRALTVVARGPKPVAVLREMGLAPSITAAEPNTWREILKATEGRTERRIAIQEYGRSNDELLAGLRARGADVTAVQVYRYDLPENIEPLRGAIEELSAGSIDAALFTSATQVEHLLLVAAQMGCEAEARAGLQKAWIASIGPATSEALEEFGLRAAMEPSHGKLGLLVREAAERFGAAGRRPHDPQKTSGAG
jgi:uroporphyrinogen-III synthase